MLARTKKINLTTEELDYLLSGESDNQVIDTIPEIIEYYQTPQNYARVTLRDVNTAIDQRVENLALGEEELNLIFQ